VVGREPVAIGEENGRARIIEILDVLAEAGSGVVEMRRAILSLGMQGRLTEQRRIGDVPAGPVDDAPFDIPASWRWSRLSEIATYNAGERVSASNIPGGAWLLDLEDIEKTTSRLLVRMRAEDRRSKSTKSSFRRGDVLYGKLRPYLDKVLVADEDGFCTTEIAPIRPGPDIDSHFLRYALKRPDFLTYVSGRAYGINLPRLSTVDARAVLVPVPPLAEQKRIVAKIDNLMALCDDLETRKMKENEVGGLLTKAMVDRLVSSEPDEIASLWEQISADFPRLIDGVERVDLLRGAVLETAIRGVLTGNARSTAGGYGTRTADQIDDLAAERPFALPNTWRWVKIESLATPEPNAICAGPFGTIFKARDFRTEGIPIIFLRHVAPGRYLTRKPGFMDRSRWEELFRPYSVWGGELLITKLGDPPGVCAIYPESIGPAMVTPDVIKMSVDRTVAEPEYLMAFLNSDTSRRLAFRSAYGLTRSRMNLPIFRGIPVPLPPVEEQRRIVATVRRLMALCDQLSTQLRIQSDTTQKFADAAVAAMTEPGRFTG